MMTALISMPYSKQKVKKLAKLERKYYSQYVLEFDKRTLFYVRKFNIRTYILNILEVRTSNSST
jgi:hypothetical protein